MTSLKITLPRESHRLRRVVVYKDKELFANALELKEQFPQISFYMTKTICLKIEFLLS